jgi:hypothetical protein
MAAKLIALAVLAIVTAAIFAIFWLIERSRSRARNLKDRLASYQHDAALITVGWHGLDKELQDWTAAEKDKRVHYIRHAQVGFGGCDPETCQNKDHWFYELNDELDDFAKLDPTPIAMAIIEKHGLQKEYEEKLKEWSSFFEKGYERAKRTKAAVRAAKNLIHAFVCEDCGRRFEPCPDARVFEYVMQRRGRGFDGDIKDGVLYNSGVCEDCFWKVIAERRAATKE